MERRDITIIFLMLLPALLSGCMKEKSQTPAEERRVEVIMNGALQKAKTTRGQIVPVGGLPMQQLIVGMATVNYATDDPEDDQPDADVWRDATADWSPGYFGGPGYHYPTPFVPSTGEIKYLNEGLSAPQIVFYEESGEYYFVRVVYPFENTTGIQTINGLSVIFSDVDGSQDIMCSNLGWGNKDHPEVKTGYSDSNPSTPDDVIVMSHMTSLFRLKLVAENAKAAEQYGQIRSVRIPNQPSSITIDMVDTSMGVTPATPSTDYEAVDFTTLTELPLAGTAVQPNGGYIMAMPATKFTIEVETEKRLWLSVDVDFSTDENPYRMSEAGHVYNITLTFMEAYELMLTIQDAKEWWMDSVFD